METSALGAVACGAWQEEEAASEAAGAGSWLAVAGSWLAVAESGEAADGYKARGL